MQWRIGSLSGKVFLALGALALILGVYTFVPAPKAATTDPFLLGQYYFNQDEDAEGPYDLKMARSYFMQALSSDPKGNPLTWYQLGRIDFLEGRYIAALYKFDKQIEYFGNEVPGVYYMIGLTSGFEAKRTGDPALWQKAEEAFTTFLKGKPESPWARTDLAWVYFSEGKYEAMLPILEEGLKFNPDNPWLLNMYGLALLNTEKRQDALQTFTYAKVAAGKLTTEEWGRAYPGNNPVDWADGLASFQAAIEKNIELAEKAS